MTTSRKPARDQGRALSPAEIEDRVAGVVAGHKMAGFDVPDTEREVARQIIAGEISADDVVAQRLQEFKDQDAAARRAG